MKKTDMLTYPQKGAYNIFFRRYVMAKMLFPITKILIFALMACVGIGIVMWIGWLGFPTSLIGTIILMTVLCAVYAVILLRMHKRNEKIFAERIKNSPLWHEYFLSDTIRFYQKTRRDYPEIIEALQPIDIPEDLSLREEYLVGMPLRAINARNRCYKAMAENIVHAAEQRYMETLSYLKETNTTLPLLI